MKKAITLALVGNPNSGKTTIFNAITGARQHVGNWPGVTVEKKEGTVRIADTEVHVVDLPGTYSLTALSLEEIIARNFILEGHADVVIDVIDASNIERNLYLALQVMEMGVKVVLALNMIDVAQGRRIQIDKDRLSQLLGVPVVATNAKKEIGVEELVETAIARALEAPAPSDGRGLIQYGNEVEEELGKIQEKLSASAEDQGGLATRWLAVKLLEGDSELMARVQETSASEAVLVQVEKSRGHLTGIFADTPELILTDMRYGFISGAVKQAVREEATDRVYLSEKIDKVLTNRLLGPVILLAVLYGVYVFTFQGSTPLVGWFEAFFKWLGKVVAANTSPELLQSLIVSWVIDGVGGVLGFVPLIAFMFLAIAFLEDTGYMARIAFMVDRVLRGFGLHGASMLALVVAGGVAGGCVVLGIMATRTMREPKERLVTILVTPLMNCGAKLPVYALLIAAFFPGNKAGMMLLLTLVSWLMVLTAGRAIRSTVLSGPSAPFVLELPPYRIPTLKGLLIHCWDRTWMYIRKAGTIILAVSVVLWAMMKFPALPPDKAQPFDDRLQQVTAEFLATPSVGDIFKSEADLAAFEEFRKTFGERGEGELKVRHPQFYNLARALAADKSGTTRPQTTSPPTGVVLAYKSFSEKRQAIKSEQQAEELRNTIGGRLGVALERITKPLNFDWRTNVALIGGLPAKEVIVSTLGTAYSLGELDPQEAGTLADQLKKEPGWNRLTAFTLLLFVMLYAPCTVTLVVMRRETGSWKWPVFAMAYTFVLAYAAALVVYSVGSFLGIGVS